MSDIKHFDDYWISLIDRREGVKYSDSEITVSFNVQETKYEWRVLIPKYMQGFSENIDECGAKEKLILSRIKLFLEKQCFLGFRYKMVRFKWQPSDSDQRMLLMHNLNKNKNFFEKLLSIIDSFKKSF